MRILLHSSDTTAPLVDLGDLDPSSRLDEVVVIADELVWIEDGDEPLDVRSSLAELVEVERTEVLHLHRHLRRRITVNVRYHDRQERHDYPPSATLRRVERHAVAQFGISPADAADLVLRRRGSTADLDPDDHVGTLAGPHGAVLELDLSAAMTFAG